MRSDDRRHKDLKTILKIATGAFFMLRQSWIKCVSRSLISPTFTVDSRRRQRSSTAIPALVELLEKRQLLTASPVIETTSDASFNAVRTWQAVTGGGYNGSYLTADSSVAGAVATWNFSGLANGQYYLQATWTPGADRATNATYTVSSATSAHGAEMTPNTATVNQQLSPNADFVSGTTPFQNLKVITVNAGTVSVQLANPGADGLVVADAIRLVPVASTDNSVQVRTERLNDITLALFEFQSVYNQLPPLALPSLMDSSGQFLSWRVQLLPFLGYNDLYQQFHLNEAWNSPDNLPLLNEMPDVFRSIDLPAGSSSTGFQRIDIAGGYHITGAGGPSLYYGVTDNTATTLLLLETSASNAVPWTAPNDTTYSPTQPLSILNPTRGEVTLAAMADGEIRQINPDITAANFQALVTWNGGEVISSGTEENIFSDTPPTADQVSQHNLTQLELALTNYYDSNFSFPPDNSSSNAADFDANGNPYLSWRVYLLPFLGQSALFNKFHLNEPWNSPNNLPLAAQMPKIFQSVGVADGSSVTGYQVFNGPGAYQINVNSTLRNSSITDGANNTLAIIELPATSAVTWTRPDGDIPFNAANPLAGVAPIPSQGLWAVNFNGRVLQISPNVTAANFAAVVTWSGGEVLSPDDYSNVFTDWATPDSIASRTQDLSNISLAMANYYNDFNSYPVNGAADQYDSSGKPLLSWRVYLLPFLGYTTLYNEFHLNEPWNSPNNLPLLNDMPDVFRSRGLAAGTDLTGFQLLTGPASYNQPQANSVYGNGPSRNQIQDDQSTTILVIETQASQAVEWTRPDGDIPFNPANPLAGLDLTGLQNVPADGILALMTDGSIRTIQPTISAANFSALASWNGGEIFGPTQMAESFFNNDPTILSTLPDYGAFVVSENKLKELALGLSNFEEVFDSLPINGNFPPSYFDTNGKPLLSWRVYLLPYIGEGALYNQFHLDEPWNSPNNLPLSNEMPEIFRSRGLPLGTDLTGFQFISSPQSFNPSANSSQSLRNISDGQSNTISLIETPAQLAVPWTAPDDFPFNPSDPFAAIRSLVSDYILTATFDGSVRAISPQISPADAAAMITWAGNDTSNYLSGSLTSEIKVTDSLGAGYANETNIASFGPTNIGTPVTETFTVSNTGSLPLIITQVNLPAGYTMTSPLVGIAPGTSAPLTIRLDATTGGSFNGPITLATNVPDQPLLHFMLNGTVTPYASTTVTSDAGGNYTGNPFPATATVTGNGGVTVNGTTAFTYYTGNSVSGTGTTNAPTIPGTYTVVAAFTSSDPDYANSQSAPVTFSITAVASKLVFSTLIPPTLTAGGTTIPIAVQLEDNFGNVITNDNSTSLTLTVNGVAIATKTDQNGAVTFNGVTLNTSGTNSIVVTSSPALTPASTTLTVSPGSPTHLAFLTAPVSSIVAGSTLPPVKVAVEDEFNNIVTTNANAISYAFNTLSGGPTGGKSVLASGPTITTANGVTTFSNMVFDFTGRYSMNVTDNTDFPGITVTSPAATTVNPAAATSMILQQALPLASATAGQATQVSFAFYDQFGNLATNDNSTVTITAGNGGLFANGQSTTTATPTNGIATLNLTFDQSGTYALTATDPEGTLLNHSGTVNLGNLQVKSATASQLVFSPSLPSTLAAGQSTGSIGVHVEDQYGNPVTTDHSTLTLNVNGVAVSALTDSTGVVTFNSVQLNKSGREIITVTSVPTMKPASSTITINPGRANHLAFLSAPLTTVVAGATMASIRVAVEDIYNNIVTSDTSTVSETFTKLSGAGNGPTTGPVITSANGVTTFSNLVFDVTGRYSLTYRDTADGLASVMSPVNTTVIPAAATQMVVLRGLPTAAITAGQASPVQIEMLDKFGNIQINDPSIVTLNVTSGGHFADGQTKMTARTINGIASFNVVFNQSGHYTFTATDPEASLPSGNRTVNVGGIHIVAATATQLVFVPSLPTTLKAGASTGSISVQIEDRYGNVVSSSMPVTLKINGATIATMNAVNGIASFSSQVLKKGTYLFSAISGSLIKANAAITVK